MLYTKMLHTATESLLSRNRFPRGMKRSRFRRTRGRKQDRIHWPVGTPLHIPRIFNARRKVVCSAFEISYLPSARPAISILSHILCTFKISRHIRSIFPSPLFIPAPDDMCYRQQDIVPAPACRYLFPNGADILSYRQAYIPSSAETHNTGHL